MERYDPGTRRWRAAAPLPVPRNRLAAAALDGRIYVAGGMTLDARGIERNTADVVAYDPQRDRWSALPGEMDARQIAKTILFSTRSARGR